MLAVATCLPITLEGLEGELEIELLSFHPTLTALPCPLASYLSSGVRKIANKHDQNRTISCGCSK